MSIKQHSGPDITEMDDLQLLSHLLNLAGLPPARANDRAHALLRTSVTLSQVLEQRPDELLHYPGLGKGAAAFLLLVSALMARYQSDVATGPPLFESAEGFYSLLLPHFQDQKTERVCVFLLDDQLRLLSAALVAQGGRAAVSCSVHRVLELAVNHRARSVVLAHNHPDGSLAFSKDDLSSTGKLYQELSLVGIPLIDHFLLAGSKVLSLRQYVLERRQMGCRFPTLRGWFPPAVL